MKKAKLAALLVMATFGLTVVGQSAHAQSKTREQVRAELIQSQHDGLTQPSKIQYPPSKDAIARNKELHAISKHAGETSPSADHHDNIASR